MPDSHTIGIGQLRVGLYVDLDIKWFEHPFTFSKFRIKSDEQIQTIRSLGLKTVRYDPALSDATPHARAAPREAPAQPQPEVTPAAPPALEAKHAVIARIRQYREAAI